MCMMVREQGADSLHMVQPMPVLSQNLFISCLIKIQNSFIFLVLAYPFNPGKEAIKRVSCIVYKSCISSCTLCIFIFEGLFVLFVPLYAASVLKGIVKIMPTMYKILWCFLVFSISCALAVLMSL